MRILVLTDRYFPNALANSICMQSIAEELQNMGCEVHWLVHRIPKSEQIDEYHGMKVFYITPDFRLRLYYYISNSQDDKMLKLYWLIFKTINRIGKLLHFPFFPMYSFKTPIKTLMKMKKLNNNYDYDMIISVYQPFDATLASYWFKKANPNVMWCIYSVDTFVNQYFNFLKKMTENKNTWLSKFVNTSDLFFYFRSRTKEMENYGINLSNSKFCSCDAPLLKNIKVGCGNKSKNIENWVYAGTLSPPAYIVDDLLNIFLMVADNKRILKFYGFGSEIEKIKKAASKVNSVKVCGYAAYGDLMTIYSQASVLISIKYSDQISAKIFEYMSYGKKIVHISGTPDDPNAEYISHYAKGIVLRPYKDSIETCAKQLSEWLDSWTEENENMPIDYSYFEMNRPEYTANLILRKLKDYMNNI